jgi:Phosphodiester glycosidase
MRPRAKALTLGLLTGVLLASAPTAPQAAVIVNGGGYQLRAFVWDHSRVRVVTFTAGNGLMIKMARAYASFSGRRITSEIGASTRGAALAVNGDFRVIGTKAAPKHLQVVDGEILSTGVPHLPGWVLSTSGDGTQAWIGRPSWTIQVTQGATQFPVIGWNAQQPSAQSVVAFTARGGTSRYPSRPTCSAVLKPVSGARGPNRVYRVSSVRKNVACDRDPLLPPKGKWSTVVLVGTPVRGLTDGDRLQMQVDLGHHGIIRDVIGGLPHVVKYGANVGPRCEGPCVKSGTGPDRPLYAKNPRTAIGISEGCSDWDALTPCQYWLVVVDGRDRDWSDGLRFPPLGHLMLRLGAHNALNLDGGGSTTMWVRDRNRLCQRKTTAGCLVNRPSYGERQIPDAVALVPTAP